MTVSVTSPVTPINPRICYVGSPLKIGGPKFPRLIRPSRLNFSASELDGKENVVPEEVAAPRELIEQYADMIKCHLERRVAIFYQQLVTSYGTHLHLELGPTAEQGERGRPLFVDVEGKRRKLCARNAAHSSTLPSLIAYDGAAWADYQDDVESEKPPGFVFMKESALYLAANATLEMPRDVNVADMAIDGSPYIKGLRHRALRLLNQCALQRIDPNEGLKAFIKTLQACIQKGLDRSSSEGVARTLEYYKEQAEEISRLIDTDLELFDRLLNIKIEEGDKALALRPIIHHTRYRAIRRHHLVQAQVTSKIRSLQASLFKQLKGIPYAKDVFQEQLIKSMPTKEDKKRIKKVLNHRKINEATMKKGQLTRLVSTRRMLSRLTPEFEATAVMIASEFEKAREKEIGMRGRVIHKLREASGLSASDLIARLPVVNVDHLLTPDTLSDIESGRITASDHQAIIISLALKIDSTLLLPNFFYS